MTALAHGRIRCGGRTVSLVRAVAVLVMEYLRTVIDVRRFRTGRAVPLLLLFYLSCVWLAATVLQKRLGTPVLEAWLLAPVCALLVGALILALMVVVGLPGYVIGRLGGGQRQG